MKSLLEPSLFEWNWLGYLWAVAVGFFFLAMVIGVLKDVAESFKYGHIHREPEPLVLEVNNHALRWFILLALLTLFVWDLPTAGKLLGLSMLATGGFGLLYLGVRRLLYRRFG